MGNGVKYKMKHSWLVVKLPNTVFKMKFLIMHKGTTKAIHPYKCLWSLKLFHNYMYLYKSCEKNSVPNIKLLISHFIFTSFYMLNIIMVCLCLFPSFIMYCVVWLNLYAPPWSIPLTRPSSGADRTKEMHWRASWGQQSPWLFLPSFWIYLIKGRSISCLSTFSTVLKSFKESLSLHSEEHLIYSLKF